MLVYSTVNTLLINIGADLCYLWLQFIKSNKMKHNNFISFVKHRLFTSCETRILWFICEHGMTAKLTYLNAMYAAGWQFQLIISCNYTCITLHVGYCMINLLYIAKHSGFCMMRKKFIRRNATFCNKEAIFVSSGWRYWLQDFVHCRFLSNTRSW